MNKTFKRSLFWCFAISVLLAAIVGIVALRSLTSSPFDINETAYIYVRPGDSEESILQQLRETAHASNLTGWFLARRIMDYKPRSGRYSIEPGDGLLTVLRRLRNGQQTPVRLTIPSVRTLDRLAGVLSRKLMMDSVEVEWNFADSSFAARYGYNTATLPALFIPDTYEFYWDTTLDAFMKRMQKENTRFWQHGDREAQASALGMTHEEVITLASIVDEETANNAEKPRVAGLYLNRLRQDIPLQADPTVKFATGNPTLRRILHAHLQTDSPYNTYLHTGLPPGPIRIPSVAGIDAVLRHENHNYLYMCAKEDFSGTHNFAATYAEHQANARRYQRALNQRGIR
ncbi:MAG: endolytic transglycosylase MltG [Bacteroidales bacterium]|nr:endolytic transglycosylase MltG [Bacteroidales bacterium]